MTLPWSQHYINIVVDVIIIIIIIIITITITGFCLTGPTVLELHVLQLGRLDTAVNALCDAQPTVTHCVKAVKGDYITFHTFDFCLTGQVLNYSQGMAGRPQSSLLGIFGVGLL